MYTSENENDRFDNNLIRVVVVVVRGSESAALVRFKVAAASHNNSS